MASDDNFAFDASAMVPLAGANVLTLIIANSTIGDVRYHAYISLLKMIVCLPEVNQRLDAKLAPSTFWPLIVGMPAYGRMVRNCIRQRSYFEQKQRRLSQSELEEGIDPRMAIDERLDCDFTLALNNRTGKYFFCRDMIGASADLVNRPYYWRLAFDDVPQRNLARLLGRLALIEVGFRVRFPHSYKLLPAISRRRPMVFTDPRECILYQLKSYDVVLCHDMGPITHPTLYAPGVEEVYTLAFARIKHARPFLMFVSEASKQDFLRLFGSDFPMLQVVHPPIRSGLEDIEEQKLPDIPSKFLLTVGSIGARKNQMRSILAFRSSGLSEEGYAYVVCGGPEAGADDVVALAKDTPGVIICGYVNDKELRWLYRNARGFVLPSLLEGFGLPAAEAIKNGLIPLVGFDGALHEVTGDAAILVDPLDVSDIAAGMRKLANIDNKERERRLLDLNSSISRFSSEAATSAWRSGLQKAIAARWT